MMDMFAMLFIALAVGFWFVRHRMTYWARRRLGHGKPKFPLGNMGGVGTRKHFNDILTAVYEKYKHGIPPIAGIYIMWRPVVLVLNLELARRILIRDFENFEGRGMYHNERSDPLTGHLFRIDGPKWRPLRQKMSPTFTSAKMKYMFSTVCDVGDDLARVCFDEADNAIRGIIDISDLMARYTTDVIGRCVFGLNCDGLRDSESEFATMGRRAFTDRRHGKFLDTFIESFPNLARFLRMCQIHQDVTDFYLGIVEETIKMRKDRGIMRNDFMNLLIEMKDRGELTLKEMSAQAFIFFAAGFDTSASTLSFALYELAKQPHLQERLRQEIDATMDSLGGEITYDAIQGMTFMEQVIAETLRKYPVLPYLTRVSRQYYACMGNKSFYIEPDQKVIIPVYAIHHDANIYPEPERFMPERFAPDQRSQRPTFSWLPFGDGPRNCIGMRFGKMQTTVGLVKLLRRFRFSVCPRTQNEIEFDKKSILLCPSGGVYLMVEQIRREIPIPRPK